MAGKYEGEALIIKQFLRYSGCFPFLFFFALFDAGVLKYVSPVVYA
jgi:hypothetical protein